MNVRPELDKPASTSEQTLTMKTQPNDLHEHAC